MVESEKFPDFNGTTSELVGHRIRFTFPKIEQKLPNRAISSQSIRLTWDSNRRTTGTFSVT
jgi:hypothetical protein